MHLARPEVAKCQEISGKGWEDRGDLVEKENLLAFLKWFRGGGCLFLPLSEREGLAHL